MATQPSNQRSSLGPPLPAAARRRQGSDDDVTTRHPLLWSVLWTLGVLCGGLVFVLLFFATVGVVSFYQAPALGIAALIMTALFALSMWSWVRSERRRHARWADRERRGF